LTIFENKAGERNLPKPVAEAITAISQLSEKKSISSRHTYNHYQQKAIVFCIWVF
jgi:hypothetical protein